MGIYTRDIIEKDGNYKLCDLEATYLEEYDDCYDYIKLLVATGFTVTRRKDLEKKFGEICIEVKDKEEGENWVAYEQLWENEEISEGLRRLIKLRGLDWAISNQWI